MLVVGWSASVGGTWLTGALVLVAPFSVAFQTMVYEEDGEEDDGVVDAINDDDDCDDFFDDAVSAPQLAFIEEVFVASVLLIGEAVVVSSGSPRRR